MGSTETNHPMQEAKCDKYKRGIDLVVWLFSSFQGLKMPRVQHDGRPFTIFHLWVHGS